MKILYSLLMVAVILVFFLYDDFISLKFQGSALVDGILGSFVAGSDLKEKINELEAENEALRAQISQAVDVLPNEVKVYSSYPFNSHKDISIAGGVNRGFQKGDALTVGNKILVGQIIEVFDSSSVAKTIYDPEWEIAVRIGEKEVDGLLKGGLNPQIDLIKNGALIKEGDIVFSASPDLPYGLEIGKVKSIKETAGAPFLEAEVELGVYLNELRNVSVYP